MKKELKIYRDNFLSKNFYIEKDITDEEFAALPDN
jgi:hypothetical protein